MGNLTRAELINLLVFASDSSNEVYSMIKGHLTTYGELDLVPVALQEYDRIGFVRFRKVINRLEDETS